MSDFTTGVTVTIPANTAIGSPVNVPVNLGWSSIESIVCVVPPGPAGNVGFSILAGGSLAYPVGAQQWFVFDDYTYTQEVSSQIETGQWAIEAYNTDVFPHTLVFYFKWDLVAAASDLTPTPLVSL